MSRPRFLADHDLNEHIIDGVLRREPTLEFLRARDVGMSNRRIRRFWNMLPRKERFSCLTTSIPCLATRLPESIMVCPWPGF
jgi:hypothetical protein